MGILYIFLHFGGYFGIFFQYFMDIFFLHFFLSSKLFFSYIFLHFAGYFGILVDTSFKLTYHQMLCFAFPGYDDEKSLLMSQKSLEKRFGQSSVFIAATFMVQDMMMRSRFLCLKKAGMGSFIRHKQRVSVMVTGVAVVVGSVSS